jgi:hypothetical protein
MNPDTMSWEDLGIIWGFELWKKDKIVFGPNAVTTRDLMDEAPVLAVRQMALEAIANGNIGEPVGSGWPYGVPQYYESLADFASRGKMTTIFLGSYHTEINIVDNGDGTYTLYYEVSNTSGLESFTRFRQGHLGILPDDVQDEGFHFGGNLDEYWRWTEVVTP